MCFIDMDIETGKVKLTEEMITGPFQAENFNSGPLESLVNQMVDPIWRRYYNEDLV